MFQEMDHDCYSTGEVVAQAETAGVARGVCAGEYGSEEARREHEKVLVEFQDLVAFVEDDEDVVGFEGGECAVLGLGYAYVGKGGGERLLTTVGALMRL